MILYPFFYVNQNRTDMKDLKEIQERILNQLCFDVKFFGLNSEDYKFHRDTYKSLFTDEGWHEFCENVLRPELIKRGLWK